MGGQVIVREADERDVGAISYVRAVAWQAAYAGLMPDEVLAPLTEPDRLAAWAAALDAAAHPRRLVAEVGTTTVGFVTFGGERDVTTELPSGEPGRAEVYAIYVLPESWSTGVGRALLHATLDELVESGYHHVSLWVLEGNDRALRFYDRHGFAVTGERHAWDEHRSELRCARRL